MNKEYNLNIDTKKTHYVTLRGIKQDENNVVLNIALTHDSVPLDLSECTVRMNYKRPDSKVLLQTANIIDSKQGKIKVNLLTKALKISGNLISDVSIFDKSNKKITSISFTIVISPSVYTADTIEKDDLDIIQNVEVNEVDRQKGYKEMKTVISNIEQIEEYNDNKQYNKLNRVVYNGSCYECVKDSKGNNPIDENYWICIAERGKDGEGSGDMHTEIYDKNNDGVVDVAEEALSLEWKNIKNVPELSKVKSVNGKSGEIVLNGEDINLSDGTTVEQQLKENLIEQYEVENMISVKHDGMATIDSVKGNTLYKRADGTYTDEWEENVELESVKDKIEVISCGKNKLNRELTYVENGKTSIKITPLKPYVFNCAKILNATSWRYAFEFYKNGINITSLVDTNKIKTGSKELVYYNSSSNVIFSNANRTSLSFNFSNIDADSVNLFFTEHTDNLNIITVDGQLEEGTTATEYEPYKEDKTVVQLKEPLRKLPNGVHDELLGNGTLIKRVGKVELNGSEEWVLGNAKIQENTMYFNLNINGIAINSEYVVATTSDELPSISFNAIYNEEVEGVSTVNSRSGFRFRVSKSKLSTPDVEGFKAWLSENPTTVLYELEEPIVEKIPQLQSLKCWQDGSLVVNSNIETLVAILNNHSVNGRVGNLENITMNKLIYDKDNNGIIDLAEKALEVEWKNVLNKPDIDELLTVESVNDKAGKVVLTSEDIIYKNNETLEQYKNKNEQTVSVLSKTMENMGKIEVYDSSKKYKKLNRVTYGGSTYEALKDVPLDTLPTNTGYWICIAEGATSSGSNGDMLKNTYDKNGNGIVDRAEEALSVEWVNVKNAPDLGDVSKVKSVNGQTGIVMLKGRDIEYYDGDTLEDFKTVTENHFKDVMPHVGMILKGYSEHVKLIDNASGDITIDLKESNIYNIKPTGICNLTLAKPSTSNAHSVTIFIYQSSRPQAISFPSSVKWQNGDIPDLTKGNTIYVLTFMNVDGTSNWFGIFGGAF